MDSSSNSILRRFIILFAALLLGLASAFFLTHLSYGLGQEYSQSLFNDSSGDAVPDFDIVITPEILNLYAGGFSDCTIEIFALDGFTSTVDLVVGGLPTGMTYQLDSYQINPEQSTFLTLNASEELNFGSYIGIITGTSFSEQLGITLTHSSEFQIYYLEADFELNSQPISQTIKSGSGAIFTIDVSYLGNFTLPINLSFSGLPPDLIGEFSDDLIIEPGTSLLTISSTYYASSGDYPIVINGYAHDLENNIIITHTNVVSLKVEQPDYQINIDPQEVIIAPGSSGVITVSVEQIYGYDHPVTITIPDLPHDWGYSLSKDVVLPGESVNLTISVPLTAANDLYEMTVQGESIINHDVLLLVNVPIPFDLILEPENLYLSPGATGQFSLTVSSKYNYFEQINLEIGFIDDGIIVSPLTSILYPGETTLLTIETNPSSPARSFEFEIVATSGVHSRKLIPLVMVTDAYTSCGDWARGYDLTNSTLEQTPEELVTLARSFSPEEFPLLRKRDETGINTYSEVSWESVNPGSASGGGISGWMGYADGNSTYIHRTSLAVNSQGYPVVSWCMKNIDGQLLNTYLYTKKFENNQWLDVGLSPVATGGLCETEPVGGGPQNIKTAIDSQNRIYLAWIYGGYEHPYYAKVFRFEDNSWHTFPTEDSIIPLCPGGVTVIRDLIFDDLDNPYVLSFCNDFNIETDDSFIHVAKENGWELVQTSDDVSGITSIDMGVNSKLHAGFFANGSYVVRQLVDNIWEDVTGYLNQAIIPDTAKIKIDLHGNIFAAWFNYDYDNIGRGYLMYFNGSSWIEYPVGSASGEGVLDLPTNLLSLTLQKREYPHFTFPHSSYGSLHLYDNYYNGKLWLNGSSNPYYGISPEASTVSSYDISSGQNDSICGSWVNREMISTEASDMSRTAVYAKCVKPAYAMQIYEFEIPDDSIQFIYPKVLGYGTGPTPGLAIELWNTLNGEWDLLGTIEQDYLPETPFTIEAIVSSYVNDNNQVFLRIRSLSQGNIGNPVQIFIDQVSILYGNVSNTPPEVGFDPWSKDIILETGFLMNRDPSLSVDKYNLGHLGFVSIGKAYTRFDGSGRVWMNRIVDSDDYGFLGPYAIESDSMGNSYMSWSTILDGLSLSIINGIGNPLLKMILPSGSGPYDLTQTNLIGENIFIETDKQGYDYRCKLLLDGSLENCGYTTLGLDGSPDQNPIRISSGTSNRAVDSQGLAHTIFAKYGSPVPGYYEIFHLTVNPDVITYPGVSEVFFFGQVGKLPLLPMDHIAKGFTVIDSKDNIHWIYSWCSNEALNELDCEFKLMHLALDSSGNISIMPHALPVDLPYRADVIMADIDGNDVIHISWIHPLGPSNGWEIIDGSAIAYIAIDTLGNVISPFTQLSEPSLRQMSLTMSTGRDSSVHVIWTQLDDSGKRKVHYKNYNPCRSLFPVEILGSNFIEPGETLNLSLCSPYLETQEISIGPERCSSIWQPYTDTLTLETNPVTYVTELSSLVNVDYDQPVGKQTLYLQFGDPVRNRSQVYQVDYYIAGNFIYLPLVIK